MRLTPTQVATLVQGELVTGDRMQTDQPGTKFVLEDGQPLHKATEYELSYVADKKHLKQLSQTQAGCVIAPKSLRDQIPADHLSDLIFVDDAQAAFQRTLLKLRPPRPRSQAGISYQAFVSPTATIGENSNIHAGAFIGEDVVIGKNCDISSGVHIGAGSVLGDHVCLFPNVVITDDIVIGNRVRIHACAVIGADGFGYKFMNGAHEKVPQLGNVIVEDDVEIGACATIDRATVGSTLIGRGTKIDNQVQIAHNCELGQHNILVGHVGFAGSVTTGDYVVCAGQVGVADHVHLGTGAIFGSKTGVHKDMPGGETYLGAPAMPAREAMKMVMAQKKVPEMRTQIKTLQAEVRALTERLNSLLQDASDEHPPAKEAA